MEVEKLEQFQLVDSGLVRKVNSLKGGRESGSYSLKSQQWKAFKYRKSQRDVETISKIKLNERQTFFTHSLFRIIREKYFSMFSRYFDKFTSISFFRLSYHWTLVFGLKRSSLDVFERMSGPQKAFFQEDVVLFANFVF